MKRFAATVLVLLVAQFVSAKDNKSKDFPLTVHIISVEERTAIARTDSISTDSDGGVSGGGGGGSYGWHLMVADIDDHRYGLSVTYHAVYGFKVGHSSWLTPGDYVGRRVSRGSFEIQFQDDKGKSRTEKLNVVSVSAIPAAAAPVAAPAVPAIPAAPPAPVVASAPATPQPVSSVPSTTLHGDTIDMASQPSVADAARTVRERKQQQQQSQPDPQK